MRSLWSKKECEAYLSDLVFTYKIHKSGDEVVLAIADKSIIGKTFKEGNIEFHVSKDFYNDRVCDKSQVKRLVKSSSIVNAVGKNIIALMIKEKIISRDSVLKIGDTFHAQIFNI